MLCTNSAGSIGNGCGPHHVDTPTDMAHFTDIVKPGDKMFASVQYNDDGTDRFRLTLIDQTQGLTLDPSSEQSCTGEDFYPCSHESAEVIVEDPEKSSSEFFPLANYGDPTFHDVLIGDFNGQFGPIDSNDWNGVEIIPQDSSGNPIAIPSGLTDNSVPTSAIPNNWGPTDWSSFNVAYQPPSQNFTAMVYALCEDTELDRVAGAGLVSSGSPKCAGDWALQDFASGPGGQLTPYFFKADGHYNPKYPNGDPGWTLIEGGDAVPTKACSTIPSVVLKVLGATCPSPPQVPSALVGTWYQHDNVLTIQANGSFSEACTGGAGGPPCDSINSLAQGNPAIYGEFQGSDDEVSGTVKSSELVPSAPVGSPISLILDTSNDTVSGTLSGMSIGPFCGPTAPADYCGA